MREDDIETVLAGGLGVDGEAVENAEVEEGRPLWKWIGVHKKGAIKAPKSIKAMRRLVMEGPQV